MKIFSNNLVFQEEEKYDDVEEMSSPNKIIKKINNNNRNNYEKKSNINSKHVKIPEIPIYHSNNIQKVHKVSNPRKHQYSNKTINLMPNNNFNLETPYKNNINVYNKKKLNSCFTASSIVSRKNSIISNPYTNINPLEYTPYNCFTEYHIKNKNDIKINDKNIPPNIMIQNIYEVDDYFNKNMDEGLLNLKNFEVIHSKNISSLDISNEEKKNNRPKDISKTLSRFLIKKDKNIKKIFSRSESKNVRNYEIKNNFDSKSKKRSVSKTLINGKRVERELSEQPKGIRNKIKRKGKIGNILNYFNNKGDISDILILRGMRNEKGGVVDFTTASPKKNSKLNKYIISYDINFKNVYKYPDWKIIASAKIIQKWWRNKIELYNDYLNKIKLIQNAFRNYKIQKYKNAKLLNNRNIDNIIKNKYINYSVTLLKKVIEVKLINNFNYFLLKMKDIILNNENKKQLNKYKYFAIIIKDYLDKIHKKNILLFMRQLASYNNYGNNDYKNKNYKNNYILNTNYVIEENIQFNIIPKLNNLNKINQMKKKYIFDKNNHLFNNKGNYKNNKLSKSSNKIILNGKDVIIFSKIKNNPSEIAKFLLKKLYFKRWYKQMIDLKNVKRTRIDIRSKINTKINHILLKNLMIDIIEKIRKEANRRTLIKAFRDINKLKYPILFYSFLKIQKYAHVKYNVMNAYASLIQKNYRYFKDKNSKKNQIFY